jgi:hypothetical protein
MGDGFFDDWTPLNASALPDPAIGPILTTNAPDSRDSFGRPSHVWRVAMFHATAGPEGPVTAFDDRDAHLYGLKLFKPIFHAVNSHATLTAALEEARGALVEEIGKRICHWQQGGLLCTYPNCDCGWKWRAASEILALILSRLGDVTPEMVEAVAKAMAADEGWGWDNPETLRDWWINQARAAISAFLAASPLAARMDSP